MSRAEEPRLDELALRRLLHAGGSLVAHLDVEEVLDDLLGAACELTDARYAAIGVLAESREGLARFMTRGVSDAVHEAIGDLPHGRGVLGELIRDPRPLRLADVSKHPRSYGFPANHPEMRTFLGVPILIRGEAWGNLYLGDKAGGEEFTAADEEATVALAAWAGIAIENARLFAEAEGRRTDLEKAVRRLEATTAIARAVGNELDLGRVLELIVKRARALVDARAVVLLLAESGEMVIAGAAGQVDGRALGSRITESRSALADVLRFARPERIVDIGSRLGLDDERLGVVGAETGLLVPLVYRAESLGILAAFDRIDDHDPQFDGDDQALLEAFAASAATAVATAQTVERDRLRHSLRAAESERHRWARELHDETLQGLGVLRMALTAALRRNDPEAVSQAARLAVDQISEEINNLRRLIAELRPAALDDLGLAPAIETLVERVAERAGLASELALDLPGERLGEDTETAVYRLVQEAISNVVKHAGAKRLRVYVSRDPERIEIEVADDGAGFDPDAPSAGFGVVGMRERAQLAGGTMELESGPGGTTVRASLPVHPRYASRAAAGA